MTTCPAIALQEHMEISRSISAKAADFQRDFELVSCYIVIWLLSHFGLCDRMDCSTPGFPVHHQLPELAQTHPFLFLHSIFSSIMVFFNDSVFCIRCLIYWSFIFISSNEYSELISIRTDRFDILVVQGTLRSRFKYYSSKVSILQHSAFFVVQLSHPLYMSS